MASSQPSLSVADQIRQLEGARKLVLGDVTYYPQVIQATLPIIGPSSQVEFRRWGAEFLAEAFATPAVQLNQKETLSLLVLETLKLLVEDVNQDVVVLRSAIQAAASIYPLAMRWIINNSYDTSTWQRMTAIKTRILRIWETAPVTIRMCCVKFAQRIVLAQTPSVNTEPRRGDPLDISLLMIPPNHPVLEGPSLEAEAFGLLDRVLGALQDSSSDALIVDATLNTLSILIRMRPATSSRILNTLLNFNPLRLASSPMSSKTKVLVKSMEKTTRMLLIHLSRRDPHNPLAGRMQQYVERLMQSRAELFDETSRKRAMPDQGSALEAKRQRVATVPAQPQIEIPPLKPGPRSLAEVFTLTTNEGLKNFNVGDIVPAPIAAKISVRTIAQLDPRLLELAINGIKERLVALHEASQQPINPETAPLGVEEDDDDYEPDYYAAEDTEQLLNKLDSSPSDERRELQKPVLNGLALPTFSLPPPPILDSDQAARVGQGSVTRVFGTMKTLEDPAVKKMKAGINRLAANSYDRDSWITVITRLATRANAGLDDISVKEESSQLVLPTSSVNNSIRESLYSYVLEDFRKRIEVAVSWLSEEWYNDRVQRQAASASATPRHVPAHYEKWALRLLDGFLPYLHAQDKVLTRFLSELPELDAPILSRVKTLCRDPSLVQLALTSLYYLIVMRPPVRDLALDAIQGIWTEYEDSRPMAAKYLQKWRPAFLQEAQQGLAANGTPLAASITA
ncbi:Uu.00g009830.m01.CDS01 [Anthostomella pinea]|uniref:Uu.00g009830.m01.CDS01 n=1 Tax=Anthostomella pinea TaxID=933095 RepID=A0AAI8VXF2_9PEZI|nr:Uu.00g009830.m01.CDS01 [Anthostomella pinea]